MKPFLTILFLLICFGSFAQQADTRYFEMRIYYCYPGRLDALVQRFQNNTTRIFEKHGIDFCCGGKMPLGEACKTKGIDFAAPMVDAARRNYPAECYGVADAMRATRCRVPSWRGAH